MVVAFDDLASQYALLDLHLWRHDVQAKSVVHEVA
jgi:hypothetical protein